MKKLTGLILGLSVALPMQAQLFTPESLTGAALGGLTGAIIGHNSGRHGGEGAAIGAGAGLLLGSLAYQARREREYYYSPSYSYYSPGYTYSGYYSPGYDTYYYQRPNYAWTGAALGGITGAVIGHNSGRHGAEGAAIGAGAGLLLGGIAEQNARQREYAYGVQAPAGHHAPPTYTVAQTIPAVQEAPQPKQNTFIHNSATSASSMSSANRLFGR
jgi:outer membrane lipoprotein SlyB